MMIQNCTEDLEVFLKQYLIEFINVENNFQHNIKEEHIAVIAKWIIEMSIGLFNPIKFSIFTFIHNQQFPRVQNAIFKALNSIFIYRLPRKEHII
ncbi:unnamed protein product [Rotaria sordida]|uniref:Uncharacterized protein n=1 Tax=Rotaria sordida TaxID=392033 RepID=A0A815QID7_9BILA|nr:unnamed protein product [Rotaria sordida]CAF1642450.1 unnamed protein product [Rotaria sordida]